MKFLMGGKLGDFVHSLFAVKNLCELHNESADLYMYDIGWEFGIENTYQELYDIIMQQPYIKSFGIYDNYVKHEVPAEYIDLGRYIDSELLYQTCWSNIYQNMFKFTINGDYKWLTYNKLDTILQNKILIQRKANVMRNPDFPYEQLIDHYGKDNVLFISSTINDYNEFPYKHLVEFYKVTTLDEWFTSINSCNMLIANLSAPAAIGHALDKKRIIELPNQIDFMHCIGEERYSDNVYWFLNENTHNLV
jgi:hypothetical protein